jgi:hypothetical protein
VARAKSTERAEARRRYRQTLAAEEAEQAATHAQPAQAAAAASKPPPSRASATQSSATPAGTRPSLLGSFRAAIAPADIRADLAALPGIVLRTRAVIVPALLSGAAAVLAFAVGAQQNIVAVLAFQALLVPPPMATSFLGGILAPRAAWLVGGLVGLIAALIFAVVILFAPAATIAGLFRSTVESVTDSVRASYALQAVVVSPFLGIAVGAFAGFYRRFLRSANPNARSSQKRAPARR